MKKWFHLIPLVVTMTMPGCMRHELGQFPPAAKGIQTSGDIASRQTREGLDRQRTVHAYYFEEGSARLTPLGRRQVKLLAVAERRNPAPLAVRAGDADRALYRERLDTIRRELRQAKVDPNRVKLVRDLPGGDGMESELVVGNYRQMFMEQDKSQNGSSGMDFSPSSGSGQSAKKGKK